MREQRAGRILINSSVLGFAALRFRGSYNATKFALEGWADTLRLELADSPIKIVLIEPGPITTRIRINSLPHFNRWINWQASPLKNLYENQLIPRLNAPENSPKDRFELPAAAVTKAVLHACLSARPRSVTALPLPQNWRLCSNGPCQTGYGTSWHCACNFSWVFNSDGSLILASCLICDRFFNASLFYYFIDKPIDQNFAQIIFGNENAKILAAKAIGRNKGKDWGLAFRA